ncbi:MAG: heavy metal transporter [Bacteroidetes bacterium HGW-Bacteroidetes-6]|jgi:copper chaperone CopZ|nr:MAG: heavy metal transporter [Bacteroidetes bacterium HGW-Bacteroidetes-6]
MESKIFVENLKCQGCVNTIKRNISEMDGVTEVEVNIEASAVCIRYDGQADRTEELSEVLRGLGYPPEGENSAGRKMKSYISCAVGSVNKNN